MRVLTSLLSLALASLSLLAHADSADDGGYTYYQERGYYTAETPTSAAQPKLPALSKPVPKTSNKPLVAATFVGVVYEQKPIVEAYSDGGYTYYR